MYKTLMLVLITFGLLIAADKKGVFDYTISPSLLTGLSLYSDNWEGDAKGSFSWTAKLDVELKKSIGEKLLNQTILNLYFGQTMIQKTDPETGDRKWGDPVTSTDKIEFIDNLDFALGSAIDPYISAHLLSQFVDKSNDYNLKGNPVDIYETVGAVYKAASEEKMVSFETRLGLSGRENVNRRRADSLKTITDLGLTFETHFDIKTENNLIEYKTDFYLFSALYRKKDQNDYYRYPDLNWENNLIVNITKIISFKAYVQMLYDRELNDSNGNSLGSRWREDMSLAISYKFTNIKK